jgi:uncharacterized coiled-coil protein SlyX
MSNSSEQIHVRVQRLEETVMFTDQTAEALGGEVRAISRSIEALARRLERLESRLTEIANREADPGLEPPPHSAGPDIPRDPL